MSSYDRSEVMEVAAALARAVDAEAVEFILDMVKEDDESHFKGVTFTPGEDRKYHDMKNAKRALDAIPDDDIGDVVGSWIKQCEEYLDGAP